MSNHSLNVSLHGNPWYNSCRLPARNVTLSGLFVHTESIAEPSSVVSVTLHLPWGGELLVATRIVHAVSPETARENRLDPGLTLEFVKSSLRQKTVIQQLVHWLSTRGNARRAPRRTPKPHPIYLNPQQRQILTSIERNHSEREMVERLQISPCTIRTELAILRELDLIAVHSEEMDARPTLPAPRQRSSDRPGTRSTRRPQSVGVYSISFCDNEAPSILAR